MFFYIFIQYTRMVTCFYILYIIIVQLLRCVMQFFGIFVWLVPLPIACIMQLPGHVMARFDPSMLVLGSRRAIDYATTTQLVIK